MAIAPKNIKVFSSQNIKSYANLLVMKTERLLVEDTTSSGDVVPSSDESSMMGASQSSGELGTVTIVNLGNGQQRYEVPEDLQQLGYTDCHLFSSGKTVLFFRGKPILVDITREN